MIKLKVIADTLITSNADIMLDSTFESKEALSAYAVHPLRRDIGERLVKPFVSDRSCIDYEI